MKRPDYSLARCPARRDAGRVPGAAAIVVASVAALVAALGGCGRADEPSGAPSAPAAQDSADPAATAAAAGDRRGGWRLANEASPYLRAHADNPVEWFPWADEAFERARMLDRPVFLSIGYSSCHWCHVMERESFENQAIADLLNENFVSIKVDREQRPDVDAQYMRALMHLTNGGGWPASLFLTADGVPFAGGTYFPPEPAFELPGFRGLLEGIHALWMDQRPALLEAAGQMHSLLAADDLEALLAAPDPVALLDAPLDAPDAPGTAAAAFDARRTVELGITALVSRLDAERGGEYGAPKFPPTLSLDFLLRQYQRSGFGLLNFVEAALVAMDQGGLHDQIAGGFHRYCVDERWEVPHFEKLLSDNAQLAALYAQAYATTGQARWAEVSRSTLAWMTSELRSPEGLYFGALDADSLPFDGEGQPLPGSHAEEGRYYLWTPGEIAAVLGSEPGAAFAALYGVTAEGNFEGGRSIPRPVRPRAQLAQDPLPGVPTGAEFLPWLDAARGQLAQARTGRPRPFRDEKCIAGWNGLAATAFARAGALLDDAELRGEAGHLAEALLLLVHEGRVAHQRFDGANSGSGTLFDHACVARGLLDAFAVVPDPRFLEAALAIAHALPRFQGEAGDFFETESEDPLLPTRSRELFDGAQPAGSSVAIELLLRLAPLDDSGRLAGAAERAVARLGPLAARHAAALPALLTALDHAAGPLAEIVIDGAGPRYDELLRVTWRTPLPAALVVPAASSLSAALTRSGGTDPLPSLLEGRVAPAGGARAWVCIHGTCQLPADDGTALAEQLVRAVRR